MASRQAAGMESLPTWTRFAFWLPDEYSRDRWHTGEKGGDSLSSHCTLAHRVPRNGETKHSVLFPAPLWRRLQEIPPPPRQKLIIVTLKTYGMHR